MLYVVSIVSSLLIVPSDMEDFHESTIRIARETAAAVVSSESEYSSSVAVTPVSDEDAWE